MNDTKNLTFNGSMCMIRRPEFELGKDYIIHGSRIQDFYKDNFKVNNKDFKFEYLYTLTTEDNVKIKFICDGIVKDNKTIKNYVKIVSVERNYRTYTAERFTKKYVYLIKDVLFDLCRHKQNFEYK